MRLPLSGASQYTDGCSDRMKCPMRSRSFVLIGVAVAASAAGCRTMSGPLDAAPAIEVGELARRLVSEPDEFKGRIIRACAGRIEPLDARHSIMMSVDDPYPHGANVRVMNCGETPPTLDAQGCLRGRIARRDGSVDGPTPAGELNYTTSAIQSGVWYLHAQCGPAH